MTMTENTTLPSLDTGELPDLGDFPDLMPRPLGQLPEIPSQKPWRLRLQISSHIQHQTLGMDIQERIVIGRSDARQTNPPDLDLDSFHADECGVSRQHAQIISVDDTLFIEDLGSTNGTRLNGSQLRPHFRYRLRDGDEVYLGTLRIMLRFIKSPLNK